MSDYCLPKKLTGAFIAALRSGELDTLKLKDMTSLERRVTFAKVVGEDHAPEVNALFESKLLLPNLKKGMQDWVRSIGGLNPDFRLTAADKIQSLDRVLNPSEEKNFLNDLVNKKLGVEVNAQEAKQIFDAARKASDLRTQIELHGWTREKGTAYGRAEIDLVNLTDSMKPDNSSWLTKVNNVASIPKTFATSILHFSAPFVQGVGLIGTKQWYQGFGQMLKYFADEENYQNLQGYIVGHPDYKYMRDGRLALTDLGDILTNREEGLQSKLVEEANKWISDKTALPNVIRASSRAFTGYLNYIRSERFLDLLNAARASGEDTKIGSRVLEDIGRVVNNFTGRGDLGSHDEFRNIGPTLNNIFFAPRKFMATAEKFNFPRYMDPRVSNTARMAYAKQFVGQMVALSAVFSLAASCGYSVDVNPISQNFLKIVSPTGEKFDMTGGDATMVRTVAKALSGYMKTNKGEIVALNSGPHPSSRMNVIGQFMRGKLAPIAAALTDTAIGKDPVDREVTPEHEIEEHMTPIVLNNFLGYFHNYPKDAADMLPALSGFFGVGLESPLPPVSKAGLDVWGNPVSAWFDPTSTDLDKEAQKIGYPLTIAPDTLKGIKLTDDQYKTYATLSGMTARHLLTNLTSSTGWNSIPDKTKFNLFREVINNSRKTAGVVIEAQSRNSDNDITRQAMHNKLVKDGLITQ